MPARAVPSHPQWAPCLAPWAGCGFYPSSWYKNSCHSVLKPGKCRGFPPGAVAWLSPPGCGRGQLELPRGPGGTLVMALVCLCCGLSFPLPTWQWGPWKDWCLCNFPRVTWILCMLFNLLYLDELLCKMGMKFLMSSASQG